MIRMRTARGNIGWHDAMTQAEADAMVATGDWLVWTGEVRAPSTAGAVDDRGMLRADIRQAPEQPIKRGPGRPRKEWP